MKQTIKVEDFEAKLDKKEQKYLRVKTDKGWMSCFKSNLFDQIKDSKGKAPISVETISVGDGKFTNIEKYYGEGDPQTEDEQEVEIERPGSNGNQGVSTDRVDRAKALELAKGDIELANKYFKYITEGE